MQEDRGRWGTVNLQLRETMECAICQDYILLRWFVNALQSVTHSYRCGKTVDDDDNMFVGVLSLRMTQ